MKGGGAFHRSSHMLQLVAAAMAMPLGLRQAAIAQIGPSESHGKGGKRAHARGCNAAIQRAPKKKRNQRRHKAMCRGAGR